MGNEEMDSKRIKDICKVLHRRGGLFCEIMEAALQRNDVYALETCLDTLLKEQFIREYVAPDFCLREDYLDDVVDVWDMLELLRNGTAGVFLYEKNEAVDQYPECYQQLAYQTAYLKCYYPDLNTWMKEAEEVEKSCREIACIGISLEKNESYGAYLLEDNRVKMIVQNLDTLMVSAQDCVFDGVEKLLNAGVASSEMGLVIRKIKREIEKKIPGQITSAVISMPAVVPERSEIQFSMAERECNQVQYPNGKLEVQIYRELNLQGANGRDVVQKAAEMAGLQQIEVIPRALAVGYAYEHMSEKSVLEEKEVALVYDWGEEYFSATLLQKYGGELDIIWQEVMESPKRPFREAYEETQELVRKVIHAPGFSERDIFQVFLSGEKTKEPRLKRWLGAFLENHAKICTMAEPALAAVKGAAVYAGK